MKLHNLRLGFATNSSSTHSMIFEAGRSKPRKDSKIDPSYFGWNYFTAASKELKAKYAAGTLYGNARSIIGDLAAEKLLNGLGFNKEDAWDIDHQSNPTLPLDFEGKFLDLEYFEDYKNFLAQDGLVILGGNDNDGKDHHLFKKELEVGRDIPKDTSQSVCRKDGDYWTLFNKHSGTRLVYSFKQNVGEYKPETPLLVDLKITDYCDKGCAFCYQDSTIEGLHASLGDVESLAYSMGNEKVFEVAIGGGEPTYHPDFISILEVFKNNGVTPNFTTKSWKWLQDKDLALYILNLCGGFAFSASNSNDIVKLVDILNKLESEYISRYSAVENFYGDVLKNKANIQIIPALFGYEELANIFKTAYKHGVRVTLLGYKSTGRGIEFEEKRGDETLWIQVVKDLVEKNKCSSFGIDTALSSRYKEYLEESEVPVWLYHIEEGKYNMYIDAVSGKYGPSSYHLDKLLEGTVHDIRRIKEKFKEISSVWEK